MLRRRRSSGTRRVIYRWHRRLGLTAGLFVLFLAITGLALNHTETLRLDERFVTGSWLQDWYGLGVPDDVVSFAAGDRHATLLGDALYLDGLRLDGQFSRLAGAVRADGQIYLVADGDVLVLLPDGRLVERMGRVNGVPRAIEKIGVTADSRLVVSADGEALVADELMSAWQATVTSLPVRWSEVAALPPGLVDELQDSYRNHMLSFERVMLDLHSGRLFGPAGPLVMDAAALLFIALVVSGFWMWLRRPPHAAPPGQRLENGRSSRGV